MVDATRVIHGVVVLLAVGAYSIVLFRGLNKQFSEHVFSSLQTEVNKNPYMKKDLDDYKAQLAEEEKQKEQMMDLEEQARRIQDQLQHLSKKHSSYKSLRYVQVEGLSVVKVGDEDSEEPSPNHYKQEL